MGRKQKVNKLSARVLELETTIKSVLSQEFDDICWMDVYKMLGELVGVKFEPKLLSDEVMLTNCKRFIASMRTGQSYTPLVENKNE